MFLTPRTISDAPWIPKKIDIGFVKRRFGLQIPPAGPGQHETLCEQVSLSGKIHVFYDAPLPFAVNLLAD